MKLKRMKLKKLNEIYYNGFFMSNYPVVYNVAHKCGYKHANTAKWT